MTSTTLAAHKYHYEEATGSAATDFSPVYLLLHGTGGSEHDLIPLARQFVLHAPLLAPRGNVSEHGSLRFFRRHAEGVFDLEDARARTDILAEWTRAALAHHALAGRPVIALGFSNGANIAALLLQRQPDLLSGALLLRPMVVLDEPAKPATLKGKHVLIASGSHDLIVPVDHPSHLATLLRAGGAEVTLHQAPNAGHNLARSDFEAIQVFVNASK